MTVAIASLLPCSLSAAPPVDGAYFETYVRPLFVAHCNSCHGGKAKGGLTLTSRKTLLTGGDTGPAIVAGDAAKSLLVQAVKYGDDVKMPPKGKLNAEEIAVLETWIAGGAPWPDTGAEAMTAKPMDVKALAAKHWSFQPIRNIEVVPGKKANPIDVFLCSKLSAEGLFPAPRADKRTLLRRVTYDLIGLPPTREETVAFLADSSPAAFEKVVDRLLASPHYGERWGRHWLDLVRYAETYGHEFDPDLPDAWRYRDYVVRALNEDLPYDRFLTEQIAGDLLPKPRRNPTDGTNESLVGTGFWRLGEAVQAPVDVRQDQANRYDNMIDVFGKTFLGLTLACARCHDHKFDPLPTKDYYSLYSILASSRPQRAFLDDAPAIDATAAELLKTRAALAQLRNDEPVADPPPAEGSYEAFGPGWRDRWSVTGAALRTPAEGPPHSGRASLKLAGALRSPTFRITSKRVALRIAGSQARINLIVDGYTLIKDPIYGGLTKPVDHGDEYRWIAIDCEPWHGHTAYLEIIDDGPGYFALGEVRFTDSTPKAKATVASPPSVLGKGPADATPEMLALAERIRTLEAKLPAVQHATAMADGTGLTERVFLRGNPKLPGDEAPRRFLEVFGRPAFASTGSGRLELAAALADPANPLVARVIVNRLWAHHFGNGLVATPDDFGKQGQPPTHPELLDWLAMQFVGDGWSLKKMHKRMLMSAAYAMSSQATPEMAAKAAVADPQNALMHRANIRRLDAEAIRDAMLLVSGRLDRTAGGPGVPPFLTEHMAGRGRPSQSGPLDGHGRRSLYQQVRRNFPNPMFMAFDFPTPFTTIGRRTVSNVPAQALVMLNNPFVIQQAELWAKNVTSESAVAARITRMYESAYGRPPTNAEAAAATAFVAVGGESVWADLAHALFNAKAFLFVE